MSSSQLSSLPNSKSPHDLSTSSTSSIGILSRLNVLNPQLSDRTDLSVKLVSAGGTSSSMLSPPSTAIDDKMKSTFRDLQVPGPMVCDELEGELQVPEVSASDRASWWGDSEKHAARPWYNPPKKKKTVPSEQIEALQSTRKVSHYYLVILLN